MSLVEEEVKVVTPMMAQWAECKKECKDALLFFRLGDFYEAFHEDAERIAKELSLTLTKRQDVPMCGVPWHASEAYIDRLVAKGYRIAIAEQLEDPRAVKGLVKRKIVRSVSPGIQLASSLLNEKTHNFFAAIYREEHSYGLALLDVTCASFIVFECKDTRALLNELIRHAPKELLTTKKFAAHEKELMCDLKLSLNVRVELEDEWRFEAQNTLGALCQHFNTATLDGFGVKGLKAALQAAGALLKHIRDELLINVSHIRTLSPHDLKDRLLLDRATLSNLEIVEPLSEGKQENTLLSTIDETKTPMGSRMLREWIKAPLVDVTAIQMRQQAITEFLGVRKDNYVAFCTFADRLKQVRDLERIVIRIQTGYAGPREYVSLRLSLDELPKIKEMLSSASSTRLKELFANIHSCEDVAALIKRALVDNPPLRLSDGGLFNPGFNLELDEIRSLRQGSHEWLANYQAKLREETSIKTLKVGYNKMFGYYIEVSRGQTDKMPDTFTRRQTLTNGERYITAELKEYEEKILSADERIASLEAELFQKLQKEVAAYHEQVLQSASAIGEVDVLFALATVADKRRYFCPDVEDSEVLEIEEGRHPVIEALTTSKQFIPNDIKLDGKEKTLMLITGPNMAGKSTYIRQIALIVILAQIGSYVPAKRAKIGIVDKLFSRIGASDDLARGQSTFMVEMAETASILNQTTSRSLVILDEIGRGTSTYDGISIAWSVAEYLLKTEGKKAKTLFATHYYELTELEELISQAVNYTVAVSEDSDGITFLHKIVPGKTDRSYGIHVAKIAGLPPQVVERAQALLKKLEMGKNEAKVQTKPVPIAPPDLFGKSILSELKALDLNQSTPLQVFSRVIDWKKLL